MDARRILFSRALRGPSAGFVRDFSVDASSAAQEFIIEPASAVKLEVHRLVFNIEDDGIMRIDRFAALATALGNGLEIQKKDGNGVLEDYTDASPIKSNGDMAKVMYDVDVRTWGAGAGGEFLVGRMTFTRFGGPVRLDGDKGEYLALIINDNLETLVEATCFAQGTVRKGDGDFVTRIGI